MLKKLLGLLMVGTVLSLGVGPTGAGADIVDAVSQSVDGAATNLPVDAGDPLEPTTYAGDDGGGDPEKPDSPVDKIKGVIVGCGAAAAIISAVCDLIQLLT